MRKGVRQSVDRGYLKPLEGNRKNLDILLNAKALRVITDGDRAVGVEFQVNGDQVFRISCSREVILTAGALETPNILLHSGIGDLTQLTRHGIAPVANLPGVGRNLQDHIRCPIEFTTNKKWPDAGNVNAASFWLWTQKGKEYICLVTING